MKKQAKEFKVGDRVTWSSQARGSTTTKTGTIVEVVKPLRFPETRDHRGAHAFANTRHDTSYIVAVPQPPARRSRSIRTGKARPAKLYWPNASALQHARGRKPRVAAPLIGVSPPPAA